MLEQATASMEPSLWSSMASWLTPTTLFLFLNLTIGTIFVSSKLHKQPNPETDNNNNNNTHDQQQQQQQNTGLGRSTSIMLYRLKSINLEHLVGSPPNLLHRLKSFNFNNNNNPQEDLTHQEHEQEQEDEQEQEQEPTLSRYPSVLHRLKSIKLYNYFSNDDPVVTAAPPPSATQETVTRFPPRQEEEESSDDDDDEEEENDDRLEDLDDTSIEEVYSKLQGKKQQPVTRTKSDTKPASGEVPTKLPKKMKKSASTKSAFSHFHESDIVAVEARRPATTREGQNGKKSGADDDQEVDAKADDFINRFKQQLKLQRMNSIIRYKEMFGRAPAK